MYANLQFSFVYIEIFCFLDQKIQFGELSGGGYTIIYIVLDQKNLFYTNLFVIYCKIFAN